MTSKAQSVRVVFCGGCNAGYDRVATAEDIRRRLKADEAFTVTDDGQPDVVVAVCGCTCACVDETAFGNARIVPVTDEKTARDILATLKKTGAPSDMPDPEDCVII
ncbi:hypothetical protein [Desulfosudis oleivorans]|uniref:Uncharacterized protein n=1 Tax=Desulfosudis oleivorans (strain DSM 6200 / JCM 39069 / Hxd3) TaxID=96561 RepID=A8ZWR3_DESOH|nr:hypothetical protein [Desulfosudis oleivorans]ABW68394.1 hypothetical protein Dole_2591 [Desulfosudis oleivorans Hxd3]